MGTMSKKPLGPGLPLGGLLICDHLGHWQLGGRGGDRCGGRCSGRCGARCGGRGGGRCGGGAAEERLDKSVSTLRSGARKRSVVKEEAS